MASVQSTIEFIKSHGHFAAECAEGVIATSEVCLYRSTLQRYEYSHDNGRTIYSDHDDNCCEETVVFPIIDGNVSNRAVRDWLGY